MKRKKLISVMLPAVATSMRDVVRGIADVARARGDWHLVLHLWGQVGPETLAWIEKGDGVIFDARPRDRSFQHWRIPAVAVQSAELATQYPLVTSNYAEIGRMAARYFYEKGLRHFAHLSYEADAFLELGFREQAAEFGREVSAHYLRAKQPELDRVARDSLCNWLAELPPPTGLLVRDDFLGQRVMDWIPADWMPERIALLGVGNDKLIAAVTEPALSSIDRGAREVGRKAAETLDRILSGEKIPAGRIDLPPKGVVERASTGVRYTSDPLVTRGIRLMEENLAHPFSTEALCREMNVSRRTLERRFQEALGRSPGQERQTLRLNRAKILLHNTRDPMSRIAEQCGYSNQQRFTEAFRRKVGATPTQYRARVPELSLKS